MVQNSSGCKVVTLIEVIGGGMSMRQVLSDKGLLESTESLELNYQRNTAYQLCSLNCVTHLSAQHSVSRKQDNCSELSLWLNLTAVIGKT